MEQKKTKLKKYETPRMDVVELSPQMELLECSGPSGVVCTEPADE